MYEDKNGSPLAQNDKAFSLGKVTAVDGTHAIISLNKYGAAASLEFLRSEAIKASFADGKVSGQISGGPQPNVDDDVMILGDITALAPGIHPVANLTVTEDDSAVALTFFCNELTKASIDQEHGVVSGDTG